jgi:hypothetical protein
MAKAAKVKQLDFTKVKDGQMFSKRHQPAGDYLGKVTKVQDAKSKSDEAEMWLFTIDVNGATYPLYCKLTENQLWKVRNLFTAGGINVPKKRVNVDPNKVVGRNIGVTLEDDEYEGKIQSVVQATFPVSELDMETTESGDTDDDDEDDEDEPPKKGKKSKVVDDDDDEDEDEEPAPKKKGKNKGKKGKSSDDELDALDIDDI